MAHGRRVLRHLLLLVGLEVPHLHAIVAPACGRGLVEGRRTAALRGMLNAACTGSAAAASGPPPPALHTTLSLPSQSPRTCKHCGAVHGPGAAQHGLVQRDGGLGDGLPIALHVPAQHLTAPGGGHHQV